MRMQFDAEDEDAYFARRDQLGEQFAQWLNTHDVPGDPNDAGLLMDWKWSYADGRLDRWTVPDVHEFLFEWCPRKLSASPADCADIPLSVAGFVEFLAHTGMLGPGSAAPSAIRRHCESNVAAFVREMGNPANFGMAKSLFGSMGGLEPDADESLEGMATLLRQLPELPPGAVGEALAHLAGDETEPPPIGPVRLPSDADRLAAVRAAPVMRQLRDLAGYCASPGRTLTSKGNLRLADARHLVDALGTGDAPSGVEKLRSAEDLPELSRLVDLAVDAGAVRRHRGKLVAVARFAALDECAAHEKVVVAAVGAGLSGPRRTFLFPVFGQLHGIVDEAAVGLLAQLLRAGGTGLERDVIGLMMADLVGGALPGLPDFMAAPLIGLADGHVERFVDLGVLTVEGATAEACDDCGRPHQRGGRVALTAAGVPVTIELLRQVGVEVIVRPEPATADAAAIADLAGVLDEDEFRRDVAEWFAAQRDGATAGRSLAAEFTGEDRDTLTALAGIGALDDIAPDRSVDALRPHLGGPHDGVVLHFLMGKQAIDPATVDPVRYTSGLVDVLAAALDVAGPSEVAAHFGDGTPDVAIGILEEVWRLDHPRVPDVLEALGSGHRVKAVAKAARKVLMKHRSRQSAALRSSRAHG
ncbi:hypothetical protein [Pseudonocardia nigra]|uniref:hypothetical protein n=1 Tax=Pseudonocardia nigra TaxID=1921578 RepID=UPI001C5EEDB3|nr:hypothetical protein [Pseudonocardia nigra]